MSTGPAARVCVLTPDGRGAIAVVRVWGPDALAVADRVFRPASGRPLRAERPGAVRFGRAGAGLGDEVVAVVCPGDPPEVELHGHGGPAAVALVVEALVAAGAERRQPVAWVRHDSTDPIEAEARVDLPRAATLRAAEILLEQAGGTLRREALELIERVDAGDAQARPRLAELAARGAVGLRLVSGWSVALAGRPNAGKSSLLNALAGYERAIVAPTPGTTRDVVRAATAFDGWPVELVDTAGLRDAADDVEAEGVARARASHAAADLTLLLLDGSAPLTDADLGLRRAYPDALVVATKADLPPAWDAPGAGAWPVSSVTGSGLDGLVAAVVRRLVPESPDPGAGVPFRPRHVRSLAEALAALDAGDSRAAARSLRDLLGDAPHD